MNSTSKWDLEVATIIELIKAGRSIAEIGDHYGYDKEYMRIILKRLRRRGVLPSRESLETLPSPPPEVNQQVMKIEFPDKKEPTFNYRDFLKTAIDLQRQKKDKEVSQLEATVKIYTDKPFAISFTSDWHLGSPYTDYEAILRHMDLWLRVPNMFIAPLGDITDNFVIAAIKSGMLSTLFSPQDQHDVAQQMFTELGQKVLFAEGGNHEGFTSGEVGLDLAASFYKGLKCPYLREGGGVNIIVNDFITYRIYAKHRYRYFSSLNVTNSVKRMHDMESPFDVGVIGHYHVPTFEHSHRWSGAMQKDTIFIVTGSYKVDDRWTREMGFAARGTIGCPTVIFFPNQKKMLPFRYVEDAAVMMESLQGLWGEGKLNSALIV